MSVLVIVIPLMVLGVIIATVPVLFASICHNRSMRAGQIETTESARQEADFWALDARPPKGPSRVATPKLASDEEVARIGVPTEARHTVNGESVWTRPPAVVSARSGRPQP